MKRERFGYDRQDLLDPDTLRPRGVEVTIHVSGLGPGGKRYVGATVDLPRFHECIESSLRRRNEGRVGPHAAFWSGHSRAVNREWFSHPAANARRVVRMLA